MVVGWAYTFDAFRQFTDTLRLTFHDDSLEFFYVAIAKRVAVDIKGQHRIATSHLGERQLFFNVAQREAVFSKCFNIHAFSLCFAVSADSEESIFSLVCGK